MKVYLRSYSIKQTTFLKDSATVLKTILETLYDSSMVAPIFLLVNNTCEIQCIMDTELKLLVLSVVDVSRTACLLECLFHHGRNIL